MDDEKKSWIFTFGFGHTHPRTGQKLAGHYVRVPGDYEAARAKMIQRFGRNWAFSYPTLDRATGGGAHSLVELPFTSYDPGELLPPTEAELRRGEWTFQTVTHWRDVGERYGAGEDACEYDDYMFAYRANVINYSPTFAELHDVMVRYEIPRTARVETFYLDYDDAVCRLVWEAGS